MLCVSLLSLRGDWVLDVQYCVPGGVFESLNHVITPSQSGWGGGMTVCLRTVIPGQHLRNTPRGFDDTHGGCAPVSEACCAISSSLSLFFWSRRPCFAAPEPRFMFQLHILLFNIHKNATIQIAVPRSLLVPQDAPEEANGGEGGSQ